MKTPLSISPACRTPGPAGTPFRRRGPLVSLLVAVALALCLFGALNLSVLQAPAAHAQATIVYVDRDAPGPLHDGLSWTNAYTTLQAALDQTNASGGTQFEIWVAEGAYYPDEGGSHVNNAISETFRISYDNVQLYGGFAATETLRTQRIPRAHPTILSGDIDQDSTLANNACHVLYLDGQTHQPISAATVLDGFTITAGNANVASLASYHGGGLYCVGSGSGHACSPALANITFSGNSADRGGGMYNDGSSGGTSNPALTNVTFSGNSAQHGGAMFNDGVWSGNSSPVLANVTFSGNSAQEDGGAMYNHGERSGNSSPTLTNVTFSGNSAQHDGGAMFNNAQMQLGTSSPVLTNVTFSGNSALYGGGMATIGDAATTSRPALTNCLLWGNTAISDGPQILDLYGCTTTVSYSVVQGGYAGTQVITSDPQLGTLGDYGGATQTIPLLSASSAIDAGDAAACAAAPVNGLDQRGQARDDYRCDIGAFELKYADSDTVTKTIPAAGTYTFGPTMVRVVVTGTGNCLTGLTVRRYNENHPSATAPLQTGHWWQITPEPSGCTGFDAALTLPVDFTPDGNDKVCRYTGSGQAWDCAVTSYTSSSITRSGISAFSGWAVSNDSGPTVVNLSAFSAHRRSALPVVGVVALLGVLVLLSAFFAAPRETSQRDTSRHDP